MHACHSLICLISVISEATIDRSNSLPICSRVIVGGLSLPSCLLFLLNFSKITIISMSESVNAELFPPEEDTDFGTPEELKCLADEASYESLPKKSRLLYETAYKDFKIWKNTKKTKPNLKISSSERVLLAYAKELSERYKPSSLWSKLSMIGALMHAEENIDIKDYKKLRAFLRQNSRGFKSVKSKVLTKDDIKNFLSTAPNQEYLGLKVRTYNRVLYCILEGKLQNINTVISFYVTLIGNYGNRDIWRLPNIRVGQPEGQ